LLMRNSEKFWDNFSLASYCLYLSFVALYFPFLISFVHKFYMMLFVLVLVVGGLVEPSKKPLNVLTRCLNSFVAITLKNSVEYRGTMVQCDSHMNILLEGATERVGDRLNANYGSVLLRGNNILYICIEIPHE